MPKRFIKRYLPDYRKIRDHQHLKIFGSLIHDPNLWHLNRRSVAGAFSVGLFCAFVPIPFQMVLAAAVAILIRVNLPISVVLVWITNPFTMPPMFFFSYKVGAWLLDIQVQKIAFELTPDWLMKELATIWQPFLLGCFVVGTISAVVANIAIRLLWRLHIGRYIARKRLARKQRKAGGL